ncbi:hypothetical protein C470_13903 [Halorubrum distributum JCM 13561]|uniref:Uncharacterized protein n=1 Tax=Halorubrum distributum JCM 13561 TaxID=1227483 RepID=M0NL06_9EURY|nr:hypothetical protein C470_13903 [Halorubrum litoreum JCM 13561]
MSMEVWTLLEDDPCIPVGIEPQLLLPLGDNLLVFFVIMPTMEIFPVLEWESILTFQVVTHRSCCVVMSRLKEVRVTRELVNRDIAVFEIVSIVSLEVVADQDVVVFGIELPLLHVPTGAVKLTREISAKVPLCFSVDFCSRNTGLIQLSNSPLNVVVLSDGFALMLKRRQYEVV